MDLLDFAIKRTNDYLLSMPKEKRKSYGQFFTSKESAAFMASLFSLDKHKGDLKVLDPGAGSGVLSLALLERLEREGFKDVFLVCYENDKNILPLLLENLSYAKEKLSLNLDFTIKEDNYILSQDAEYNNLITSTSIPLKVDLVISNPPYLKLAKDAAEAKVMQDVCYGSPNLYFLFAQMSAFNLKEGGEMVYIVPRSWTSGSYFTAFRKSFFSQVSLEHIHQFISRDKVFDNESVLQETIIIKVRKSTRHLPLITITTSNSNKDFERLSSLNVPYNEIICGIDNFVFIPSSTDDLEVVRTINTYHNTLIDEGLKMKTGIVIDFRHHDNLREKEEKDAVPLFYSQHIKDGFVNHNPSGKNTDWITTERMSLVQKNKNYVFLKRFTAKEERRRLQCGIYLASNFKKYKYIATQNKLNFIDKIDGSEIDIALSYGLYALFNTTLFDKYYRILNGSTQVNSTEVNTIPVPPIETIRRIGESLINEDDLSTNACDRIVMREAYEKDRRSSQVS